MDAFTFTVFGYRIGGYLGGGRTGSGSPLVKGYSSGLFWYTVHQAMKPPRWGGTGLVYLRAFATTRGE